MPNLVRENEKQEAEPQIEDVKVEKDQKKPDGRKKKKIEYIGAGVFSSRGYEFKGVGVYTIKNSDESYFLKTFPTLFKKV